MSNDHKACERAAKAMAALGISPKQTESLNTFVLFAQAWEAVASELRASLTNVELTESQFGVLEALFSIGPQCQRALGQKILKSSGNLTMVVDNLERRGLVIRERDENDRRHVLISITEAGRTLIRRALPQHAHAVESTIGKLSKEDQDEFRQLCRTVLSTDNVSE